MLGARRANATIGETAWTRPMRADRSVNFTVVSSENKGLTVPIDERVVVRGEENARRK